MTQCPFKFSPGSPPPPSAGGGGHAQPAVRGLHGPGPGGGRARVRRGALHGRVRPGGGALSGGVQPDPQELHEPRHLPVSRLDTTASSSRVHFNILFLKCFNYKKNYNTQNLYLCILYMTYYFM